MSLPHVPDSSYVKHFDGMLWMAYTPKDMKAYGQACRAEALEEAAKFIEGGSFLHDQSPAKLFAEQLAPKIRGLK